MKDKLVVEGASIKTAEQLDDPDYKLVEFDQFRFKASEKAFVLSPKKWIEATEATAALLVENLWWDLWFHILSYQFEIRPEERGIALNNLGISVLE